MSVKMRVAYCLFCLGKLVSLPCAYWILVGERGKGLCGLLLYVLCILGALVLGYIDRGGEREKLLRELRDECDGEWVVRVVGGRVSWERVD